MSTNLIPFTLERVDEFYQLTERNRSYLKKWLPWLDSIQDVKDTATFIENSIASDQKGYSVNFFIMADEIIVGTIGLREMSGTYAIVGYWIDEAHQSMGITTQALQQLIKIIKDRHLSSIVYLRCSPLNKASAAVAKKCGFIYKTTLPQAENLYGRLNDLDVYEFKISSTE
jgi:acyltransferases